MKKKAKIVFIRFVGTTTISCTANDWTKLCILPTGIRPHFIHHYMIYDNSRSDINKSPLECRIRHTGEIHIFVFSTSTLKIIHR